MHIFFVIMLPMLAMLIIIRLLETCSWTELEGHLNHIHVQLYIRIPVHMTNI